jgi:hypothetical protein
MTEGPLGGRQPEHDSRRARVSELGMQEPHPEVVGGEQAKALVNRPLEVLVDVAVCVDSIRPELSRVLECSPEPVRQLFRVDNVPPGLGTFLGRLLADGQQRSPIFGAGPASSVADGETVLSLARMRRDLTSSPNRTSACCWFSAATASSSSVRICSVSANFLSASDSPESPASSWPL